MMNSTNVENLQKEYDKLLLDDVEGIQIKGAEIANPFVSEKPSYVFMGQLFAERDVDMLHLQRTLSRLWIHKEGVNFEKIGCNRFLFKFFHIVNFNRVGNGAPWTFNNKLWTLKEIKDGYSPLLMEIDSTPIWVQVFGIPCGFVS